MALSRFGTVYLFLALIALPQVLAAPPSHSPPTAVNELTFNPAEGQVPIVPNQGSSVFVSVEEEVLNGHNYFRSWHGASSLSWDDTLADYANYQASRCVFEHSGGPYGENLAVRSGPFTITDGINGWMREAGDYNPQNPRASHFTQVVWKSTTHVGCAFVTCPPGSVLPAVYGDARLLWCNYSPPGNIIGQYPANVDP